MTELSGAERIGRLLRREPVDRIGLFEHFWGDTQKKWTAQGHLKDGEDLAAHFGFDMSLLWPFNMVADLDFEPQVVEETEETILTRDGNGALLRRHKLHDATPEHVDFAVKDRASWLEMAKPLLKPERRRIDFDGYARARKAAGEAGRFFCWCGVNVFELMHPLCGHEHMLVGMALDPAWVRDMVDTYAELTVSLMEILFEDAGAPDGIWFYEDMGFKGRPFMSPDMYREIIMPGHRRTFDYADSLGLSVIVHSCGYVEPLIPGLIQAGMDCLQVMEVKAGMDPLRIKSNFGDCIALFGGMDARNLVANDRPAIARELAAKVPPLMEGGGYILHSDHSIPDTCEYETYRFFVDEGLRLGTY
ncbi:MAG: uroporphyrinogen decarboxylase family protein [Planctomycetota bacterium]